MYTRQKDTGVVPLGRSYFHRFNRLTNYMFYFNLFNLYSSITYYYKYILSKGYRKSVKMLSEQLVLVKTRRFWAELGTLPNHSQWHIALNFVKNISSHRVVLRARVYCYILCRNRYCATYYDAPKSLVVTRLLQSYLSLSLPYIHCQQEQLRIDRC